MIPPSPTTIERWLEDIQRGSDEFAQAAEVLRSLAQISSVPDGFPRGGGGDHRSSDRPDPTFDAVQALEALENDRVAEWVEDCFAHVRSAVSDLKRVRRLVYLIEHRADLRVRDAGAGTCLACGREVSGSTNDKIKGGHCAACYREYYRWKEGAADPSPILFRKRRWAELCEQHGQEPSWSAWKDWQDGHTSPPRLARKRETA